MSVTMGVGPLFSQVRETTRITCYSSNINDTLPPLSLPHNASHHHDNTGLGYCSCTRFSRGYDLCGHVQVTFRLCSRLFSPPVSVFPERVSIFAPSCFETSLTRWSPSEWFLSQLFSYFRERQSNPASRFQGGSERKMYHWNEES